MGQRMEYFAYLSCGLFAAITAIHLTALALDHERLRRFTKVLLIPLLALAFVLMRLSFGLDVPWMVVAALLLGCTGDVLLLGHRRSVRLPLGLASFSAGHVLYIIAIWHLASPPAWWLAATLVIVYGSAVALTYKKLLPYLSGAFRPTALFYMLLISTMGASAASYALTSLKPGAFILLAGSALFMLSDAVLSFEIFRSKSQNSHLKIMVPYIAAQTLITAGFFLQFP